jgi:predicted ATPase
MQSILSDVFEENSYFNGEGAPLKASLTLGPKASRVAIVVGSNGSGKSFAVRVIASWLLSKKQKVEPLQVSMKYRTEAGLLRALQYGPFGDGQDSTGANSVRAVEGALSTAQSRTSPCWILLDEPDTGLSEDFTHALGTHLALKANEGLGAACGGLVVVTHSRELVRGLLDTLVVPPHFVHIDEAPQTLPDWLGTARRRSLEELLALPRKSVATFRALNKVLKD